MPVEFVNELPAGRGRYATPWGREESEQLRTRPGEWAIIDRTPSASQESRRLDTRAQQIRQGHAHWASKGAFQASVRRLDGERRLYARYVGEPDG